MPKKNSARRDKARPQTAFVGVPLLHIDTRRRPPSPRSFNSEKEYSFRYDIKEQAKQPHVVKFSGGRSSGMLLFTLLKRGLLDASRGDVVIFNNTSAEHPATYQFAAQCKKITEQEYGIPFLWTEFQTYEDASNGDWKRNPSYRLVQPKEFSAKNPDGYHSRGEVFEELLSWKKFLPTKFQRICTQEMKLFVTQEFLRDWFALKPGIERMGHWYGAGMLTDEAIISQHKKNGGKTPDEILLAKTAFVRERPYFRPEQLYSDYSQCIKPISNETLKGKSFGEKVSLAGDDCVDYVTFVGFRADEQPRVMRMKARNYDKGNECESESDPHLKAPEGEYVYAPLAEIGVDKSDVTQFWNKQNWDLLLPENGSLSNCVFCFLKGSNTLTHILGNQKATDKKLPPALRSKANTPSDIEWWRQIEKKYARDLILERREVIKQQENNGTPIIGFWGFNGKLSYSRLAENKQDPAKLTTELAGTETALPCDCTD